MKANTSKLMKSLLQNGIYGAAAVAAIGLSGDALAQVTGTKHNLSTSGSGSNHVTTGTGEICVFCHTPHAAGTAQAPLWNRVVNTNAYTVYASSTMDDTANQPGGVSLACLSCHDGAQAMDVMINQPGSGGYVAAGSDAGYTWQNAQQLNGTQVTNIGTDLSNDHPIGIIYCGGSWLATAGAATCADADFRAPTKISNTNWYVDSGTQGTSGSKDKTDPQLYASGTEMRVECGSCHDPHVAAKGTGQVAFLRVTQAGSALCLTCHTK